VELRHLRYFVGVAEALNFRAAAEALHVSAPALSKQIRLLEEDIGVRLLDRDTTGARLTTGGAVFLDEARKVLVLADAAAERAREAAQGRRGRLTVGTIGRTLAHRMPQCLAAFDARYPDIHVELAEMDYARQSAGLKAGEIDVGFMPAHIAIHLPARLRQETVLRTPICAVLAQGHRLAKLRSVSLRDLAAERLLFLGKSKSSVGIDYARTLFSTRGLSPLEIVEVKGFLTLMAMVAASVGVSVRTFESAMSNAPGVVVRPLTEAGADLELDFRAVYRDSDQVARIARRFIAVLREVVAAKPCAVSSRI